MSSAGLQESNSLCVCVLLSTSGLQVHMCVELARTIYIRCMYGTFGREITKYTVIYGVYIRFWPTLHVCGEEA